MSPTYQTTGEQTLELLRSKFGKQIQNSELSLGDAVIRVGKDDLKDVFQILRMDADLQFDLFINVTAVDWMDEAQERFEVVYHFMSLKHGHRARIKAWVPEEDPKVTSATSIWKGADFMEREVFDMYGIEFEGHPDLRRILMYDEFEGYPLRKDYPIQAKQPRIPLRHPEVRNTAVDMQRPALVQIGKAGKSTEKGAQS